MTMMTGAELAIALLERQGITHVAGIPGGANLPLYDALGESRIVHVLARSEQGAGFIAQGMARVSGSPGVCLVTSGPGVTNVLTALADARLDSIPVVCISGQVPLALIGTDAFQEVDACGVSLPLTKHRVMVRAADELLEAIPEAFRIAASGRPGPVLVDIPKDVQQARIDIRDWPEPGRATPPKAAEPAAIEASAREIAASRRPILYLGGGVVHAGGAALARRLAERADLPTVMTLMALGCLPHDHPLSLGMLGMHGAAATNHALQRSDLLVAVGARFDDRATGNLEKFCPHARVVHLDIDPAEINKLRRADCALVGDVTPTLEALLRVVQPADRVDWHDEIAAIRRAHPEPPPPGLADPRALIRFVGDVLGPDAVVTTDVGQHQMWAAQAYPFARARQWLTSGGLGTMGFGLPAAIGAALAEPGRPVVCITGDGSILMNLQELAVAAELDLDIKLLMLDNGALGLVRQQQDLFYGGRRVASQLAPGTDFCAIARGFGLRTLDLADDVEAARLTAALSRRGLVFVRAPVDGDARVYPMVPPGRANDEMLVEALA